MFTTLSLINRGKGIVFETYDGDEIVFDSVSCDIVKTVVMQNTVPFAEGESPFYCVVTFDMSLNFSDELTMEFNFVLSSNSRWDQQYNVIKNHSIAKIPNEVLDNKIVESLVRFAISKSGQQ